MVIDKVTIKYNGQYIEFPERDKGFETLTDQLDINPNNPSDAAVTAAVMGALGANSLSGFVIDPPETERMAGQHDTKTVLNIRPTATYG
jgi:hypothetical protein